MENTNRRPTDFEIDCAKVIRGLAKNDHLMPVKTRIWMQECYFHIQDNGIDAEMIGKMRDCLEKYGGTKAQKMAYQLEAPASKNVDTPVFKNIYSAVFYFIDKGMVSHKKYLSVDDMRKVLNLVCDEMGVDYEETLTRAKKRKFVECRVVAAWLCKDRATLSKIATSLGRHNHTSIMYYISLFNTVIDNNAKLRKAYLKIKQKTGL